jgi:phosphoglycolate phosphatase-like HAD superfamily hydrolase
MPSLWLLQLMAQNDLPVPQQHGILDLVQGASPLVQGVLYLLILFSVLSWGIIFYKSNQVRRAKPDPDLFLAAAVRLGAAIETSVVIGDSVWDLLAARRARALGVGLLSGGYGEDELMDAGAYRVYQDPADLLEHLDELGVRLEME